jgi:hypothetical protein
MYLFVETECILFIESTRPVTIKTELITGLQQHGCTRTQNISKATLSRVSPTPAAPGFESAMPKGPSVL